MGMVCFEQRAELRPSQTMHQRLKLENAPELRASPFALAVATSVTPWRSASGHQRHPPRSSPLVALASAQELHVNACIAAQGRFCRSECFPLGCKVAEYLSFALRHYIALLPAFRPASHTTSYTMSSIARTLRPFARAVATTSIRAPLSRATVSRSRPVYL